MDENRLSGTAKNPHGQTQQADESVQDLYGQAKDAAGEAIHAVGNTKLGRPILEMSVDPNQ